MNTTPKRLNAKLEKLISHLGLDPSTTVWLKLTKVTDFLPETSNCLINCMVQQKYQGGALVFGWLIWQNTMTSFCEAEFHCVWQDTSGALKDITPRLDGEKRICFIPDSKRQSRLDRSVNPPITRTFDNVRLQGEQLLNPVQILDRPFLKNSLLKHLS
jgi:hypothetical protein